MPEVSLAHKRSKLRRPLSLLFTTEPDDGSFFMPPELAQRLNLIQHLIQHSEQLLLILAEQGSGKSTLLHQVQTQAGEDWKIFKVSGHPNISEERALKSLLETFNVRSDGKTTATLHDTLRSHIAATRYSKQLPVLLVDDAHMLPLETLHLLLDLVMSGEAQTRLRVMLFCEPQITSVLAAPEFSQIRNTLIHTLDIPALSEKQVNEYLKFRLEEGRYYKKSPFSGMTVRRLFEQSDGRIGLVNPLAQKIMNEKLEEQLESHEDVPAKHSKFSKVAWVVILALLFVGLLLGLQWLKKHFITSESIATESLQLPTQPLPLQGTNETSETANNPFDLNPNLLKPTTSENNQGISTQSTHEDEPQGIPSEMKAATLVLESANNAEQTENVPETIRAETVNEVSAENTQQEINIEQEKSLTAINTSEYSSIAGVKSAYWLSQQNAQHYTVQILGSYTLEGVSRFIRKYDVNGNMALYLTDHKKRDWYVLTYGIYDTQQAAKQALRQLPSDLRRKTKPWLRSLSSIQEAIAKRTQ